MVLTCFISPTNCNIPTHTLSGEYRSVDHRGVRETRYSLSAHEPSLGNVVALRVKRHHHVLFTRPQRMNAERLEVNVNEILFSEWAVIKLYKECLIQYNQLYVTMSEGAFLPFTCWLSDQITYVATDLYISVLSQTWEQTEPERHPWSFHTDSPAPSWQFPAVRSVRGEQTSSHQLR